MTRLALILAIVWFPAIVSAQEVDAERVRDAAARALVSIQKAQADAAVARACTFLESRTPRDTEERSYSKATN